LERICAFFSGYYAVSDDADECPRIDFLIRKNEAIFCCIERTSGFVCTPPKQPAAVIGQFMEAVGCDCAGEQISLKNAGEVLDEWGVLAIDGGTIGDGFIDVTHLV
jgi:hypothetical protein